jgi:hypothetical protein
MEGIFAKHMQWMHDREIALAEQGIKIFRLSTTERSEFKECRRRWDLSSYSRQGLEPKKPAYALSFGTAIHYGLEQYYAAMIVGKEVSAAYHFAEKWKELAIATVYSLRGEKGPEWEEVVANMVAHEGFDPKDTEAFYPEWLDDEFEKALAVKADEYFAKDVQDYLDLGKAMLDGYQTYSTLLDNHPDTGFKKVLYTEKEFAVPIPDPSTGEPYRYTDPSGQVWEMWLVGRFDMIVLDVDDWVWVLDHKSSKDKLNKDLLILDDQMTMYQWALREIFRLWNSPYINKIAGCYYNVLRKKLPTIPRVLVNGKSLSKAKDIDTTYDLYLQAIMDNGFDPADYQDILQYLQGQPNTFFERAKVRRNQYEIAHAGSLLLLEAIDMLNAPYIYPNFTWDCRWKCDFKELCLSMNRNDDCDYLKEALFQKRVAEDNSVYLRESTVE